jgi:hypothetical protein
MLRRSLLPSKSVDRAPWPAIVALLLVVPAAVLAAGQYASSAQGDHSAIDYANTTPMDPVAQLQKKIDSGEVTLRFDPTHGYLGSVLQQLHIPVASQGLVFSRTSLQVEFISPWRPRALYFNDDVYVGYVQNGPIMELASVDPKLGAIFYSLQQQPSAHPTFERQGATCLQCHDSSSTTGGVPGFIMRSVYADKFGYPIETLDGTTTDATPWAQRWGGWYVTGTHASAPTMANMIAPVVLHDIGNVPNYIANVTRPTTSVTDLSKQLDTTPYLAPGSDIVALLVLAHQTHVHNLITEAAYEASQALYDERIAMLESGGDPDQHSPLTMMRIKGAVDRLVRGLTMAKEAPFPGPVKGTSDFAAEFQKRGPSDSQGRSLRDLDLQTRLFKYPLSYLIYSDDFRALPDIVKNMVYQRIFAVLTGQDHSLDDSGFSAADRETALKILAQTSPDFSAFQTTLAAAHH